MSDEIERRSGRAAWRTRNDARKLAKEGDVFGASLLSSISDGFAAVAAGAGIMDEDEKARAVERAVEILITRHGSDALDVARELEQRSESWMAPLVRQRIEAIQGANRDRRPA